MTTLLESVGIDVLHQRDITAHEPQMRLPPAEAAAALELVLGRPAVDARARLRFGPGRIFEPVARLLDKALGSAERQGRDPAALVVAAGNATAAEDIVRIRRKAHGVADWISTPTADVTIVLRPAGLAVVAAGGPPEPQSDEPPRSEPLPPGAGPAEESAAELAIREALYDVIDPDLGVNVVDLGFVRRVRIADDGRATLTMTLTSAACPLTEVMERNIAAVLAPTGTDFTVRWEWVPCWRPVDITPDGREQLRAIGFSAF